MSGLGLFSSLFGTNPPPSLQINTAAKPEPIVSLSKSKLIELRQHIDDGHGLDDDKLKLVMIGVLTALLAAVIEGKESQHIENLKNLQDFLINGKDTIEHIRSTLLGEFAQMIEAASELVGGRRKKRSRRSVKRRGRHTNKRRTIRK